MVYLYIYPELTVVPTVLGNPFLFFRFRFGWIYVYFRLLRIYNKNYILNDAGLLFVHLGVEPRVREIIPRKLSNPGVRRHFGMRSVVMDTISKIFVPRACPFATLLSDPTDPGGGGGSYFRYIFFFLSTRKMLRITSCSQKNDSSVANGYFQRHLNMLKH